MNQVGESASSMMTHQPHLLDFSSPPNPAMAFDHNGLLALHDTGTDIPAHRVLIDTTPWPQQVSLSHYNTAAGGSSLVCQQQPFTAAPAPSMPMQPFQLRSSRILGPAKELLSEFCSLEGDLRAAAMNGGAKMGAPKAGKWDDVEVSSSSSPWGNPSLSSMDLLELERRKIRLLSMVEEVDRRYRRYREQIRAVELSFEAVAGAGAAQVYTKLALPAMSRHFRCLRDALVGQIRALRKAMGERDGGGGGGVLAAAGASKGDTPSLRMLDQCLRQQRAFQQSVESYPWRPQRGLPERAVAILRSWLFEHFLHPYPNDVDKHILARQTGLSRSQVSNWFINARVRIWKPMIEDMYLEETKQSDGNYQNPNGGGGGGKPVDHNSTTASSTVTVGESSHLHGRNPSSYIPSVVADGSNRGQLHSYPSLHGGGGAVSLTLGLQQQTFGSSMQQQQQQQSLMLGSAGEEEEDVVLPYKNLMGSQLLHNLAGYETDVRRVYN